MDVVTRLRPRRWTPVGEPGPDPVRRTEAVVLVLALLTAVVWLTIAVLARYGVLPDALQPRLGAELVVLAPDAVSLLLLASTSLIGAVAVLVGDTLGRVAGRAVLVLQAALSATVVAPFIFHNVVNNTAAQVGAAGFDRTEGRAGVVVGWTLLLAAAVVALGPRDRLRRTRVGLAAAPPLVVLAAGYVQDQRFGTLRPESADVLLGVLPVGVVLYLGWQAMSAGRFVGDVARGAARRPLSSRSALGGLVAVKLGWLFLGVLGLLPGWAGGRVPFGERLGGPVAVWAWPVLVAALLVVVLGVLHRLGGPPAGTRESAGSRALWLVLLVLTVPAACRAAVPLLADLPVGNLYLDNAGYASLGIGTPVVAVVAAAGLRAPGARRAALLVSAGAAWVGLQAAVWRWGSDYVARSGLPVVEGEGVVPTAGHQWEHTSGLDYTTVRRVVGSVADAVQAGVPWLLVAVLIVLALAGAYAAFARSVLLDAGPEDPRPEGLPTSPPTLVVVAVPALAALVALGVHLRDDVAVGRGATAYLFDVASRSRADLLLTLVVAGWLLLRRGDGGRDCRGPLTLLVVSTFLAYPGALVPTSWTAGLPALLLLLLPFVRELVRLPAEALATSGLLVVGIRQVALATVIGVAAYLPEFGAALVPGRREPQLPDLLALGARPPVDVRALLPLLLLVPAAYLSTLPSRQVSARPDR